MSEGGTVEREAGSVGHDPIEVEAAEWITRLSDSSVSLEEAWDWQRWMDADARHREAFARIEAIWEAPWELLAKKRHRARRSWGFAIAASLVAAIAAAWFRVDLLWPDASAQVIQTAIGENRAQVLEDGSRVTLGGDTRLSVSLGSRRRHFELLRGEAFFVVARDPSRPFTVTAGNATVTAVGTEFDVHRSQVGVDVAVVEGRVMVAAELPANPLEWLQTTSAQRAPVQLSAGQQATVNVRGARSLSQLPDAGSAIAWQSGRLVFRGRSLREALSDVNRYAPKPIVMGDPDIGDFEVTGTVLRSALNGWIASLESAFNLRAVEYPDRIELRRVPPKD